MKGQASFRSGRRLSSTAGNARPEENFRSRALGVAAAALPLAAAMAVTAPHIAAHAAAASIVAPTYVRTIGAANGESTMYPSGDAVDASGNVYVADTGNYRIEKYAAGTTTLLWSVGVRGAPIGPVGSGNDSFTAPRDLATDGTFVYVADTDNADVQVLSASTGAFVKLIKTFGAGGAQTFQDPIGISVGHNASSTEEILVSDGVSGNVYVFNTSFALQFTVAPTASNEGTRDAATDSTGNIYTDDYRGNVVDKYGPTGTFITSWGSSSITSCLNVAKPYGIDVDTADTPNRVYVASSNDEQVKVFDTSGNCLDVGSTGSNAIGTKVTAPSPTGIFQLRRVAVGSGVNPLVYLADLWGLKILTFNSSDGTIASSQPVLGSSTYPLAGGLNEDHGIAIDPSTNQIFVANTVNQRIERFDLPSGNNAFDWGTKGVVESSASFNWAQGIGYDPANGNVWVANTRNNRIDEFSADGTPIASCPNTQRLTSSFNWPMAVAFDPAGTMYVADTFNNRIQAVSVSQCASSTTVTPIWSVGTRGSGTSQFIKPWDLVYDPTQNRLLVADTNNNRIIVLNPATGAWEGVLPITQGTAAGQVEQPEGIAVDATGNIWVADTGNNRIEEFTSSGVFANQMTGTYGCCFSAPNNAFNAPQGLAFDSSGQLYVADANNNRIQVFQPAGTSAFGSPGPYTAVAPFRICDTRPAGGGVPVNQCNTGSGPKGPIGQGAVRALTVGVAGSNVPTSGVSAVVVNVTGIAPSQSTFLTLYPDGGSKPGTSNLNPGAGRVIANLVEVAVSTAGRLDIFNQLGTINVAVDIEGYVSTTTSGTAGLFNATTPTRICDTRTGAGIAANQCNNGGTHPILAGHPLTFDVHGSGSPVPATGVSAVVFNLTAIAPSVSTVLTAYPSNRTTPTASNVNVAKGAAMPNRVIVPVPSSCAAPNCTIRIANSVGSVNVAVDIDGWFTDASGAQSGALFSGVAPSRLCDTRVGNPNDIGCSKAAIAAGKNLNINVAGIAGIPPLSSGTPPVAVVVNLTAVGATTSTFVTAYSSDLTNVPGASDINVLAGQADTNLVIVPVGTDGTINVFNAAGSVNLIVDVLGYYSQTGGSVPTFRGDIFKAGGVAPMYPAGGQTDASGNMYLADSGGDRIDKLTPGGTLSYIVPSTGAPLGNPRNLSLDASTPSDMWVTDTGNNGLVEMTTAGTVLERFNASSTTPLNLTSPFGNDNDATGVYVADTYDGRIIKVDKSTGAIIWSQTTCNGAMSRPRDVAVGSDTNIYAVDTDNNRVVELNPATGSCITSWDGTSPVLHQPRALTSDGGGGLWIAEDGQNPAITHYTNAGVFIGSTLNTGSGGAGFVEPEGVFLGGGTVVAADPFANQVVSFTVTAGVPAAAGTATNKGGPVLGGFNNPFGVAYAPNGDCFVSDMFNQRIEKFTGCTGTPIATGQFGGGNGEMQNPRGISVSADGSTVILTNSEDERIDFFSASDLSFQSSITAVASTCGGENLFFPHQVAYDAANNSYWVADTNNNRIVDLSAATATAGNCLANWASSGTTAVKAPRGIAWDGTSLWVANAQTGQILKCSTAGACTLVAARTGTPTIVSSPWNLTIANGNLYIADELAGAIVVMNMTAPYSTVYTFGTPGTDPSLGQLGSPRSVSVNPLNGEVAVADFDNNDISLWR